MPGRFQLDDKVTCVRNNNATGKRHAGKISKVRRTVRIIDGVAPGARVDVARRSPTRDHGSNHNSDLAVCLCCWVDAVTGGASKPDDLWYYSIKYDDGEEEHKVGPARIFLDK